MGGSLQLVDVWNLLIVPEVVVPHMHQILSVSVDLFVDHQGMTNKLARVAAVSVATGTVLTLVNLESMAERDSAVEPQISVL